MVTLARRRATCIAVFVCAVLAGCEKDFTLGGTGGSSAAETTTQTSGSSSPSSASSGTGGALSCLETTDPDLVAYYSFDETSGTIVHDCSGHGHDANVISTPPGGGWSAGHFGGGFAPNGGSGCIDLGTAPELSLEGGSFTVAAWVRSTSFSKGNSGRYIAGRTLAAQNAGWRIGGEMGERYALEYFDTSAGTALNPMTASSQPTNTWTHVVGTFDPSNGTNLYVDGALAASGALSTVTPDASAHLRIGCSGSNDLYFDGTLDEVRFYARALTAQEVSDLFALVK